MASQTLISEDEEGAGPLMDTAERLNVLFLAFLAGPLVIFAYWRTHFFGLNSPDAMDFAQIARNLLRGNGFTTQILRPLTVALVGGGKPMPDVTHGPLYPLMLMLAFLAHGVRDSSVGLTSAFFFMATLPLVFFLADQMYNRRIARVSAVVFVLNSQLVAHAISGTSMTLSVFLITAVFYALYQGNSLGRAEPSEKDPKAGGDRGWLAAAGVFFGLAYLCDYNLLVLLIPFVFFVSYSRNTGRALGVGTFLAAFALVSLPWMLLHNWRLAGNPVLGARAYEIAMGNRPYPGYTLYRSTLVPGRGQYLMILTEAIVHKLPRGIYELYNQVPLVWGWLILGLVTISLFFRFRRSGGPLRYLLVVCLLFGSILAITTAEISANLAPYVALLPMAIIVACAFYDFLVIQFEWPSGLKGALRGFFVLFLAFPLCVDLVYVRAFVPGGMEQGFQQVHASLKSQDQVVVTDIPWAAAWYGDLQAVWLPQTPQDFERLDRSIGPIDLICLSSYLQSVYGPDDRVGTWERAYSYSYQYVTQRSRAVRRTPAASLPLAQLKILNHRFQVAPQVLGDGTTFLAVLLKRIPDKPAARDH